MPILAQVLVAFRLAYLSEFFKPATTHPVFKGHRDCAGTVVLVEAELPLTSIGHTGLVQHRLCYQPEFRRKARSRPSPFVAYYRDLP